MARIVPFLLALGLLAACPETSAAAATTPTAADTQPRKTLHAFSEREFARLIRRWRTDAEKERSRHKAMAAPLPPPPAPPAVVTDSPSAMDAPAATGASQELDKVVVTGSAIPAEATATSITNVQTAGVDEGGIVKIHGDHLVVLRRGRLFTLRIGGDALRPIATVDAYAPGTDPSGAWYDEMLVSGDTVVVIGFSYARGGTEIGLFDIARDGGLKYRATYHLRSNDYYSSRNYASRLIGDKLIFYTPLSLDPWNLDGDGFYPALRRWRPQATPQEFKRILPATHIYRSDDELDPDDGVALHTVAICDLGGAQMTCRSSAVLGPESRAFYVSADAVYVWTTQDDDDDDHRKPNRAAVFRLPLDGSAPSALKTSGSPIDQLSFLQGSDGYLNVVVAAESDGEGMWKAESKTGDLALLRVRLRDFGDGTARAPVSAYRPLPGTANDEVNNRYIGDWLIYGAAPDRWDPERSADRTPAPAFALRYADRAPPQPLRLSHDVERIEAMGRDAVLVGSAGKDLRFTSLRLGAFKATPDSIFVQRDAAQGESRTHGFFYRADGEQLGIVGLPIIGTAHGNDMSRYLDQTASVLYLRNRDLALGRMGRLDARAERAVDDGCAASCVDWYGDARPIFIGDRVFALLGYELVEGRVDGDRVRERRRVDFAPKPAIAVSR